MGAIGHARSADAVPACHLDRAARGLGPQTAPKKPVLGFLQLSGQDPGSTGPARKNQAFTNSVAPM